MDVRPANNARRHRSIPWLARFAVALFGLSIVTACGSPPTRSSTEAQTPAASIQVAYAGSLGYAMDHVVGPAFQKATGIAVQGRGGGSFGLARLISAGELHPDVLESIGYGPISLTGKQNATWAVGFASSPLVIAYSPQSRFAPALKAIGDGRRPLRDLFDLMAQPGFHLGRTDPQTDPQGQLFVLMMHAAVRQLQLPTDAAERILGPLNNAAQVFDEGSILSRLQAGQLDATSAYLPEAVERHLPCIRLPDTLNFGDPSDASLYAQSSITLSNGTVVHGTPVVVAITALQDASHAEKANQFVAFTISAKGKQLYTTLGYTPLQPIVYGDAAAVPSVIQAAVKLSRSP